MHVSVEATTGLERRLTVSLPTSEIDVQVAERLQKARKTVVMNGFRKGKVPMSILQQRIGEGVRQEVLGELINRSYGEALIQEDIRPAGQPTIEPIDTGSGPEDDSFSYTAVFEVYPQVHIGALDAIKLEKVQASVEESDVDDMVENLRVQNKSWETVDRAAAEGDTVVIDYVGTVDGEEFPGGSAEESSLELGSGLMMPGFESGILGMNTGETRNVEVTFPDDYPEEDLRGKDAEFAITLNDVTEGRLPDIDDEFIREFGEESGELEAFRSSVRANMELELENRVQLFLKNQVMDALCDIHEFEVPKIMVEEQIMRLKQGLFQPYGRGADIDLSQFPDEPFVEQAHKRVKLGLIVSELVSVAELSADEESVRTEISKIASTCEDPEEMEMYYYSNENMYSSIQLKVLEDRVIDHVIEVAEVRDIKLSYAELMEKT